VAGRKADPAAYTAEAFQLRLTVRRDVSVGMVGTVTVRRHLVARHVRLRAGKVLTMSPASHVWLRRWLAGWLGSILALA
jgi:hypothetical protein